MSDVMSAREARIMAEDFKRTVKREIIEDCLRKVAQAINDAVYEEAVQTTVDLKTELKRTSVVEDKEITDEVEAQLASLGYIVFQDNETFEMTVSWEYS